MPDPLALEIRDGFEVQDRGGDPVVVALALDEDPFEFTKLRVRVVRCTAPDTFEDVAHALSGEAGTAELDGTETCYPLAAYPTYAARADYRRKVRCYMPRLGVGAYHLAVDGWDESGGAWTELARTTDAVSVLARLHGEPFYRHKQDFPTPPFHVGPQSPGLTPKIPVEV